MVSKCIKDRSINPTGISNDKIFGNPEFTSLNIPIG
jgi:hypothetical protein